MSKFNNPKLKINGIIKVGFTVLVILMVGLNIHLPNMTEISPQTELTQKKIEPKSADSGDFIFGWDTRFLSEASEWKHTITLPLVSSGIYDFNVSWGDGTTDTIITWDQLETTHIYANGGIYTVRISGTIGEWNFNNTYERRKLCEISQWGNFKFGNTGNLFYGCSNLELTALDAPNLEGITSLYQTFLECTNLGSKGNMNAWDVSSVTNMESMFYKAESFNQPLNNWDVSSVTNMESMFYDADSFNQSLDAWDVSSVTNMKKMFFWADIFNQPLNAWNVSSVKDMEGMFHYATSFNQPLNDWNVSSVMNMRSLLGGCTLSSEYYDAMLVSWAKLPLQSGVSFGAGNSQYSRGAAQNARLYIVSTYGWEISDGYIKGYNLPSTTTIPIPTSTDNESPLEKMVIPGYSLQILFFCFGIVAIGIMTQLSLTESFETL